VALLVEPLEGQRDQWQSSPGSDRRRQQCCQQLRLHRHAQRGRRAGDDRPQRRLAGDRAEDEQRGTQKILAEPFQQTRRELAAQGQHDVEGVNGQQRIEQGAKTTCSRRRRADEQFLELVEQQQRRLRYLPQRHRDRLGQVLLAGDRPFVLEQRCPQRDTCRHGPRPQEQFRQLPERARLRLTWQVSETTWPLGEPGDDTSGDQRGLAGTGSADDTDQATRGQSLEHALGLALATKEETVPVRPEGGQTRIGIDDTIRGRRAPGRRPRASRPARRFPRNVHRRPRCPGCESIPCCPLIPFRLLLDHSGTIVRTSAATGQPGRRPTAPATGATPRPPVKGMWRTWNMSFAAPASRR